LIPTLPKIKDNDAQQKSKWKGDDGEKENQGRNQREVLAREKSVQNFSCRIGSDN
jgi:hypothetical protein